MRTIFGRFVVVTIAVLNAPGVVAADSHTHRCASVTDDAARLACYDAAFGKPAKIASASPDDDGATAREEFGLSEPEKRARRQEPADRTSSITGEIARLDHRPTGELVVSLADGPVWAQIESDDSRARVKVGDPVTIRKATLGSYLLVGPDRIAVRVRRVK